MPTPNESGAKPGQVVGEPKQPEKPVEAQPTQATPPVSGTATPPQGQEGEVVTLSKKELDDLRQQAARASEAQSRADILERQLKRSGKRKVEEPQTFQSEEVMEVTRRVQTELLTNADYQKLLQGNPALARVLVKNPLQILETDEFIDVNDAVDQVLAELDKLLLSKSNKLGSEAPPTSVPPQETPPAPTFVNPSVNTPVTDEVEKELKRQEGMTPMQRMEAKIAKRINVK
jgi:hypothetical protein